MEPLKPPDRINTFPVPDHSEVLNGDAGFIVISRPLIVNPLAFQYWTLPLFIKFRGNFLDTSEAIEKGGREALTEGKCLKVLFFTYSVFLREIRNTCLTDSQDLITGFLEKLASLFQDHQRWQEKVKKLQENHCAVAKKIEEIMQWQFPPHLSSAGASTTALAIEGMCMFMSSERSQFVSKASQLQRLIQEVEALVGTLQKEKNEIDSLRSQGQGGNEKVADERINTLLQMLREQLSSWVALKRPVVIENYMQQPIIPSPSSVRRSPSSLSSSWIGNWLSPKEEAAPKASGIKLKPQWTSVPTPPKKREDIQTDLFSRPWDNLEANVPDEQKEKYRAVKRATQEALSNFHFPMLDLDACFVCLKAIKQGSSKSPILRAFFLQAVRELNEKMSTVNNQAIPCQTDIAIGQAQLAQIITAIKSLPEQRLEHAKTCDAITALKNFLATITTENGTKSAEIKKWISKQKAFLKSCLTELKKSSFEFNDPFNPSPEMLGQSYLPFFKSFFAAKDDFASQWRLYLTGMTPQDLPHFQGSIESREQNNRILLEKSFHQQKAQVINAQNDLKYFLKKLKSLIWFANSLKGLHPPEQRDQFVDNIRLLRAHFEALKERSKGWNAYFDQLNEWFNAIIKLYQKKVNQKPWYESQIPLHLRTHLEVKILLEHCEQALAYFEFAKLQCDIVTRQIVMAGEELAGGLNALCDLRDGTGSLTDSVKSYISASPANPHYVTNPFNKTLELKETEKKEEEGAARIVQDP